MITRLSNSWLGFKFYSAYLSVAVLGLCCGARVPLLGASPSVARGLSNGGSRARQPGRSGCTAQAYRLHGAWDLQDQGLNPCLLPWQFHVGVIAMWQVGS